MARKINSQWLEDHVLTQEDIDEFRHPGPDIMGGNGGGSGGGGSGGGDPGDSSGGTGPGGGRLPPPLTEQQLSNNQRMEELLNLLRQQFTGATNLIGEGIGQFGEEIGQEREFFSSAADRFLQQSEGTDPRFQAFKQNQFNLLRGQNEQFFDRRGTGGSSASLNALQRSTGDLDTRLGFQNLQRQDENLTQSLSARTTGLELSQIPIALQMQLAALITKNQAQQG